MRWRHPLSLSSTRTGNPRLKKTLGSLHLFGCEWMGIYHSFGRCEEVLLTVFAVVIVVTCPPYTRFLIIVASDALHLLVRVVTCRGKQ